MATVWRATKEINTFKARRSNAEVTPHSSGPWSEAKPSRETQGRATEQRTATVDASKVCETAG